MQSGGNICTGQRPVPAEVPCPAARPTWREVQARVALQAALLRQQVNSLHQLGDVAGADLLQRGLARRQPAAAPLQLGGAQPRHDGAHAVGPLGVHAAAALLVQLHALVPADDGQGVALRTSNR